MTGTQRDVVDLLMADHREFDRIFTELEDLRGRTDEQSLTRKRDLVDEVAIGLVKHSVAEETQVYPRVEKQIDEEEAEHAEEEHAEAEETMKRLERVDAGDPAFDDAVAELIREIRHHVQEEESRMFGELRASFSREDLVDMAEKGRGGQEVRSHPAAPDDPERRRRPDGRGPRRQPARPSPRRGQRSRQEQGVGAPPERARRYRRGVPDQDGAHRWNLSAC